VNAIRANFGAMQNRLTSTSANLLVADENLSAANSRIRDTDVAAETSEMTRNNILLQAGVSILGQANQSQQLALKLLG
jgi:flagellin